MTKTALLLCLLLVLGAFTLRFCSLSDPAASRDQPLSRENRLLLKVCAGKSVLSRKDLEEIALTYKVIKNERADIDAMLDANKDCRVGQLEQIDFNQPGCTLQKADANCQNGTVLVPIR